MELCTYLSFSLVHHQDPGILQSDVLSAKHMPIMESQPFIFASHDTFATHHSIFFKIGNPLGHGDKLATIMWGDF